MALGDLQVVRVNLEGWDWRVRGANLAMKENREIWVKMEKRGDEVFKAEMVQLENKEMTENQGKTDTGVIKDLQEHLDRMVPME